MSRCHDSYHMSVRIGQPNHLPHLHHPPHQLESRTIQPGLCWLHHRRVLEVVRTHSSTTNTTVSFYIIICHLSPFLPHVRPHIQHLVGPPQSLQHQHDVTTPTPTSPLARQRRQLHQHQHNDDTNTAATTMHQPNNNDGPTSKGGPCAFAALIQFTPSATYITTCLICVTPHTSWHRGPA